MISTQYISRIALTQEKVDSFEVYPFSIPSIRSLDKLELHPKVTFFYRRKWRGKIHTVRSHCRFDGVQPGRGNP